MRLVYVAAHQPKAHHGLLTPGDQDDKLTNGTDQVTPVSVSKSNSMWYAFLIYADMRVPDGR